MNFREEPKMLVQAVEGSISKEFFIMAMYSGKVPIVVAFAPTQLKLTAQWLMHYLAQYEREYGPVPAEWKPPIPSPVNFNNPPPPSPGNIK